ncbi:uncharacterized protein LOC117641347 [Thrips palmi]|uniref:Uncharacterized protein LOC117641347 n=1 Tax=Thrips palmi TaxID=161013 RepID=A0A6P8Y4J0_THRPL|nr:uncharacterized protein LOC117641347 [Thrips palmi]
MPRKCCICNTSKGVKYNEVPSNPTLRAKWLSVIPNKDNLGENPVVCNLHFQESDYDTNSKYRRLKRGVVPMVIPHEELDHEPYEEEGQKERYLHFFGTQVKEKNAELLEVKTQLRKVEGHLKHVTKHNGGIDAQLEALTKLLQQSKEESKKKTLDLQNLETEIKILKAMCHRQEMSLKSKDKLIQELKEKQKELQRSVRESKKSKSLEDIELKKGKSSLAKDRNLQMARIKLNNAKARSMYMEKIRRLQKQLDILKAERKDLDENVYYQNLENLIINMDTDRRAAFVLDQVKLYNKKVPRYSDLTLQECIIWEDTDPSGYEYVRSSDLLTLPAQWTMKRHLGPMDYDEVATSKTDTLSANFEVTTMSDAPDLLQC